MSDDLKPCPFCGGYAIGSCEDVGENKTFWACEVFCTDCYASTRRCYGRDSDGNEDDADAEGREEWNRRIEALEARAEKAEAERDVLRDREKHFASVLSVADGGQYRNDWDAAIRRVVAERDALREALRRLLSSPAISDGDQADPEWGCSETYAAEINALAALNREAGT